MAPGCAARCSPVRHAHSLSEGRSGAGAAGSVAWRSTRRLPFSDTSDGRAPVSTASVARVVGPLPFSRFRAGQQQREGDLPLQPRRRERAERLGTFCQRCRPSSSGKKTLDPLSNQPVPTPTNHNSTTDHHQPRDSQIRPDHRISQPGQVSRHRSRLRTHPLAQVSRLVNTKIRTNQRQKRTLPSHI